MWSRTRSLSLLRSPVRSFVISSSSSFVQSFYIHCSLFLSLAVWVSALLCLSRAWYVAYTLSANVLYVDINVNATLCVFVSRCSLVGDASRFAVLFPTILLFFPLLTINKIFLSAIVVRVRACSFFASFISFAFSSFPQIKSFEIEIIYRLGARSLPIIIAANIAFVARIQLSALSVSFKYINLYVGVFVCLRAWFSFLLMQFSACLDDLIFFLSYDFHLHSLFGRLLSHPKWSSFTSWLEQNIVCIIIIIWICWYVRKKILFVQSSSKQ